MTRVVERLTALPIAEQQKLPPSPVELAVRACVGVVHATKPQEEFEQPYYKGFDAYYNPADGTVQNNAYRNGDRPPLYLFYKCMVEKGFPLTTKQ